MTFDHLNSANFLVVAQAIKMVAFAVEALDKGAYSPAISALRGLAQPTCTLECGTPKMTGHLFWPYRAKCKPRLWAQVLSKRWTWYRPLIRLLALITA